MQQPLWQQLLAVWLSAALISTVLLGVERRRPYKFFWLIPYPDWKLVNWRPVRSAVVQMFRMRPVSSTAVLGVPLVAVLLSLGLCVVRAVALFRQMGAAP